jgi:hypothetical protein
VNEGSEKVGKGGVGKVWEAVEGSVFGGGVMECHGGNAGGARDTVGNGGM